MATSRPQPPLAESPCLAPPPPRSHWSVRRMGAGTFRGVLSLCRRAVVASSLCASLWLDPGCPRRCPVPRPVPRSMPGSTPSSAPSAPVPAGAAGGGCGDGVRPHGAGAAPLNAALPAELRTRAGGCPQLGGLLRPHPVGSPSFLPPLPPPWAGAAPCVPRSLPAASRPAQPRSALYGRALRWGYQLLVDLNKRLTKTSSDGSNQGGLKFQR